MPGIFVKTVSGGIRGKKGPQGVSKSSILGVQGYLGGADIGEIGNAGEPGPTCICRLDEDLLDVEIIGPTGNYLTYNNSLSQWKNTQADISTERINFENIQSFDNRDDAYESLGSRKLWTVTNENQIRLTRIITLRPKAYFTFDEGSGTEVADTYSSNGDNTMTINNSGGNNIQWTTGKFGNSALRLVTNGTSTPDQVRGLDTGLPTSGQMSMCAWLKYESHINTFGTVMAYGNPPSGGRVRFIGLNTTAIWAGSFINDYNISMTTNAGNGDWHHLVGTWDGDDVTIYYDGVLVGPTTTIAGTNDVILSNIKLGRLRDSPGNPSNSFRGSIDDAAIFDVALTLEQVEYLWNNGDGRRAIYVPE